MKKINITITGCMGKMGQKLIKSSRSNKDFNLVSLTESTKIKKKISGIKPELNTLSAFKKSDVIKEFTIPSATLKVLKIT